MRTQNGNPLLSIVIPSFNVLPYLKYTLDSLLENTESVYELIIIDDNSNAETQSFLRSISHLCTVVFNQTQQYVTHNWNQGIRLATGKYVAILNNDLRLPKAWDLPLIQTLNDDVWVSSPYLTDPIDKEPFANIKRFNNINLAGPCFMLQRKTFDVIGLFPEVTRIWYNDVWLSWVIQEVHRKKAVFVPDVVVHHFKSKSSENLSESRRSRFVRIISQDYEAFEAIKDAWQKNPNNVNTISS